MATPNPVKRRAVELSVRFASDSKFLVISQCVHSMRSKACGPATVERFYFYP